MQSIAKDIIKIGELMYRKGFVAANDGNISARTGDGAFIMTPSGVSKGEMREDDLLVVDGAGKVLRGSKKLTSEYKMHLAVYEARPDINAVVHAHPPYSTAFAISGQSLDKIALPEVVFSLGKVMFTEYATPSTPELPAAVRKVIGQSDALILRNHGALTAGRDVLSAYYKMETLEHFARITFLARMLGGERELSKKQIETLFDIRENVYGQSNDIFKK